MSAGRWILVGGIVAAFIFAKGWVMTHPKSSIALVLGAALLIFTEPAEAQ